MAGGGRRAGQVDRAGRAALPALLEGTNHPQKLVRQTSHEVLRKNFPTEPRAVEAFLRGLDDADATFVRYACAFHLGTHRIAAAREPLRKLLERKDRHEMTYFAAAKSLAELGERDVIVHLWAGLGSDDYYPRYLSNLGMKALTGRDLTAFDYPDVSEDSFVSGPAVGVTRGQPIEKAERRARRWRAVADFGRWLKAERPELFAELDQIW